jgi:hypothetical protein
MEAVTALIATTRISTDGQSLTYSAPDQAVELFVEDASRREQAECQLPEEWSVGPVHSWRSPEGLAVPARAIDHAHSVLVNAAKTRLRPPPAMGSELRMQPAAIVRACESKLGVPPEATREILKDLTYDPSVKWTDVMYQPLLPMGSGDLLTCRVLIEGNRFERNLLALLPRLPGRRQGEETAQALPARK